ncbi:MAG: DNA mismatch repair protein MutS [Planctomycetes bacterium]|nr:DNA mismatch repair protein MutS [Planctomycetota bacterium]
MAARASSPHDTPAMQQFARAKREHPDCLVFFRMGDFYELFYEDAKEASRLLGITLTTRTKDPPIPMAGVPVRAVDGYLQRLLSMGRRVAVCEQMQDPADAKGVVDREVVRVVTPGTLTEDAVLDARANNFLAAALPARGGAAGLAWVDLSTGEFLVEDLPAGKLADALARVDPSEVLVPEAAGAAAAEEAASFADAVRAAVRGAVTPFPDWAFEPGTAARALREHFGTADLRGFGVEGEGPRVGAAGAVLQYLRDTQKTSLGHLRRIGVHREEDRLVLDRVTLRSLEIVQNLRDGGRDGTLLSVLDRTVTATGARRLRSWLVAPLRDRDAILDRQSAVEELAGAPALRARLREALAEVRDLERLAARTATGRAHARDLAGLRESAQALPAARAALEGARSPALAAALAGCDPMEDLRDLLARSLVDDPPTTIRDGGIFRDGFLAELDELRAAGRDGRRWLADLQARESERSGIPNLRVGFNSVFGYYLETSRGQSAKAPADWERRQSLKGAERFVTPELKDLEKRILGAEDRAKALEHREFLALREKVAETTPRLQATADAVARADALASLAEAAAEGGWVRPLLEEGPVLEARDARHPVVEASLRGERFVPNDVRLGGEVPPLALITGPNMSGKSVYLRQAALLVLLAQAGSFVPAASARVGLADRIFTRIGASDDLAAGRSTFMVEMSETANILHNATERSVVLLDEVGRGTSTFDGVSLAWAITEHLATAVKARTLFATHYHELTELAALVPGVRNLSCAVREWKDGIVFLRRIEEGGTDRSYGLHVAKLAGIPRGVVERAARVLHGLEQSTEAMERGLAQKPAVGQAAQLALFAAPPPEEDPILGEMRETDPDRLSPIEALMKLREWTARLKRG